MDTRRGFVVAGKTVIHHHHHYTEWDEQASVHHHHHHHTTLNPTPSHHHATTCASTDAPHATSDVELVGRGVELFEDELLPQRSTGVDHFPLPYGHPLSYMKPVAGLAQENDSSIAVPLVHWFLPPRPIAEAEYDDEEEEDEEEEDEEEEEEEEEEDEEDYWGGGRPVAAHVAEEDDSDDANLASRVRFVTPSLSSDQQSRELMWSGESEGACEGRDKGRDKVCVKYSPDHVLRLRATPEGNSEDEDDAWYDDQGDEEEDEDVDDGTASKVEFEGYAGYENDGGSTEGQAGLDLKKMLGGAVSPRSVVAAAVRMTTRVKGEDEVITKSTSKVNIRTTKKCFRLSQTKPPATLTQLYPALGAPVRSDRLRIVIPQHRKGGRTLLIPALHIALAPHRHDRPRRGKCAFASSSHPDVAELPLYLPLHASQHLATDLDAPACRSPLNAIEDGKRRPGGMETGGVAEERGDARASVRSRAKDGVDDGRLDFDDGDDRGGKSGQHGHAEEQEKMKRRTWQTGRHRSALGRHRSALDEEMSRSASFLNRKFGPLRPSGLLPTLGFSYADRGRRTFSDFRPYRGLGHFEHCMPSVSASCTTTKSGKWRKNNQKKIKAVAPKRERKPKAAPVASLSRADDSVQQDQLTKRMIVFPVHTSLPPLPSTPSSPPLQTVTYSPPVPVPEPAYPHRDQGFSFMNGVPAYLRSRDSMIQKGQTMNDFRLKDSQAQCSQDVGWVPHTLDDIKMENMMRMSQDEAAYANAKPTRKLLLLRRKEEQKKVLLEDIQRNLEKDKKSARRRSQRIEVLLQDCQKHRHALHNIKSSITRRLVDSPDSEPLVPAMNFHKMNLKLSAEY